MPTVAREGEFEFVIHTKELPYEPAHVHVWFGGEETRINLLDHSFMGKVPRGKTRAMMKVYRQHYEEIIKTWEELHGGFADD